MFYGAGFVFIDGYKIMMEHSLSFSNGKDGFHRHWSYSLRIGSPRHIVLACLFYLHAILCFPPRFCNVSVSCCWTDPEAHIMRIIYGWFCKWRSCYGLGNFCTRDELPNHSFVICRRISCFAYLTKIRKKFLKYEWQKKPIQENIDEGKHTEEKIIFSCVVKSGDDARPKPHEEVKEKARRNKKRRSYIGRVSTGGTILWHKN